MFNVFEMMRAGQGNPGLDSIARQFGLSQEQAMQASAALLPAFFLGLQRSAADPNAFAQLMTGFNTSPFAAFFNNPTQPVPAQAQSQGEQMLGQIFGSADLTRRVAEQAATWSGVSAQIIQQMMPIMAAAVVGSLSRFSEIMRSQTGGAGSTASAPGAGVATALPQPFAAWMELMRSLMGGQASEPPKPAAPKPAAKAAPEPPSINPWADMALAMMGQARAPAVQAEPEPEPDAEAKPEPPEEQADAWARALESGREAQQQYIASLQSIFDQFWGAGAGSSRP